MLAGTQPVGTEIHAITGELALQDIANLHGISQAAAGFDGEIAENRMLISGVINGEIFFPGSPSPFVDFILVRRAPVVGRWQVFGLQCLLANRFSLHRPSIFEDGPQVKSGLLEIVHKLFTKNRSLRWIKEI